MYLADYRKNRNVVSALAAATCIGFGATSLAPAADGTWANTSGGLWSDPANWNAAVADGSGFNADFSTLDITATTTVSLDSARTIGSLTFGDTTASHGWVLNNNGDIANVLTLAGGSPTITIAGPAFTGVSATLNAEIAGTAGLTINGTGNGSSQNILVLGGDNSYSGGTTISTGVLRAAHNNALGAGDVTVVSGARLQLDGGRTIANNLFLNGTNALSGNTGVNTVTGDITLQGNTRFATSNVGGTVHLIVTNVNLDGKTLTVETGANDKNVTIAGTISGGGAITKTNNGMLTINGNNTAYSGVTTLNRGDLAIGHDSALGTGMFAFSVANNQSGTLRSTDATARTIANPVTLSTGNTGTRRIFGATSGGTGDLNFTNAAAVSLGTVFNMITVNNTTTFAAGFTGSGGLNFNPITAGSAPNPSGVGTLVINGDSDYAGLTSISGGALLVNGAHTGGGAYTIGALGTLGGSGSIASTVTVDGTLAPGSSIDTLTVGGTTFNAASVLEVELGAGVSDLLAVNGDLDLAAGALLSILGTADGVSNYTIATYTGTLTGEFNNPVIPDGYTLDYGSGVNSAITLQIPEPATLALLGLASLCMMGRTRNQRRQHAAAAA